MSLKMKAKISEEQMMMSEFKNEPLANFTLEVERKKMMDALAKVKSEFGRTYGLHTADQVSSASNVITSRNPAFPDQIIGSTISATKEDADRALKIVTEGSKTWKKTPASERISLLEKLADWMVSHKYELSAWMVYEVGKSWKEADADTCEGIDFCRYYAREMNRLAEPRMTQMVLGENDTLAYFPKGVSVVIAPWNFPFAILAGMAVASLVTGNTVIIKPAEQSVVIGAKLAQGLKAVGFPQDAFFFLPGVGEEIGPMIVNDPRVDIIAFTGSADVGLSIIESAARKPKAGQRGVKKVIAEMGGKNALIIDEDADQDEAILGATHSAFGFQGQKCSALSRLLVHEKIYDAFVKRFVEAASGLKMGDPANPEFQMGPVIDEEAQKRILKTIQDAKTRMKVLFESKTPAGNGYFVPQTIFECTDAHEKWFQNEIFGPVILVKKFSTLEEGIELVNSVPYALTGGIYSRSPSHIEKAKAEMEVGNLYINRAITGATVQRHPFGGFKLSGIGSKAGGPDYLLQFLEARTVSENVVRRGFAGEKA
ncbi:MAG: L-glutamate gamma-semialdehyde dehydrogenase [Deltaproteobacteria bacterium]|nr:L-glutamate gamma-semialdehyde dehydrogenase [Deltaproteobacteria bacterium]